MTLRLLFLPEPAQELAVSALSGWFQRRGIVCKHTAHVMQKPGSHKQNGGGLEAVYMVKKKLRVNITLRR